MKITLDKANKLLDINKMLTRSNKIEEILGYVIHAASELIGVTGVFIIYMYDQETNTLRFAEGQGVDRRYLKKITFQPGESISGKIFLKKKAKLFTSEEEIDEYMSNMSEDNYYYYHQGVFQKKIKSVFAVPILNKNKCHGIVIVDSFKESGSFTEEDMQVIEVVADQSAIAIDNSNLYNNLKRKNAQLTQSLSIHHQFYQLIIEGQGIEKVLELLERIIGSKVFFEFDSADPPGDKEFPIVRGDETLGVLKLGYPFESFNAINQIAIEQASSSIAIELIKNNALFEKEIHFREEVFNQLIDNVSAKDLLHALQYINWNEAWKIQCIIMEGRNEPLWKINKLIDKERFINEIERIGKSLGLDCLIFTKTFQLIILIPVHKQHMKDQFIQLINARFNKLDMVFGIGREAAIKDLAITYDEAIRSVRYAKANDGQIIEYAMLGIERLLFEVDEEVLDMFVHDKLHEIERLDKSFISTLHTFIALNKNHKQTAEALFIHPNTLYYRLRKIEEVLNIRIENENDWIDLVIAFRLYVASNKNGGHIL